MNPAAEAVGIVVLIPVVVLAIWVLWLLVTAPAAVWQKVRQRKPRS